MSLLIHRMASALAIVVAVGACDHRNYIGAIDAGAADSGSGGPADGGGPSLQPPGPVVDLYTGTYNSCAVIDSGRVYCWGQYVQPAPTSQTYYLTATALVIGNVQQMTSKCFLLRDGTVSCWTTDTQPALVAVPGLSQVQQIVSGTCSCALVSDGTVRCWGDNNLYGQCGAMGSPITDPVTVSGLSNVIQIASGRDFTCALGADGGVWCWGSDAYGQLGDGVIGPPSYLPKAVPGLTAAKRIASNSYFACAALASGQVTCWGSWDPCIAPECGPPTPMAPTTLVRVGAIDDNGQSVPVTGITDVALADSNLCLLTSDSGDVGYIQCMENPGVVTPFPPYLANLQGAGFLRLAVAVLHGCALKDDGEVYCWGNNQDGEIGTGQMGDVWPQPTGVHW